MLEYHVKTMLNDFSQKFCQDISGHIDAVAYKRWLSSSEQYFDYPRRPSVEKW